MKLRFTDPTHRLSQDTLSFARRLKAMEALDLSPLTSKPNNLIIIANGCPDNRVILILAHILNGTITTDIAFPEYKQLSIFNYIHEYAKQGYNNIIVVIDQEDHELKQIYNEVKKRIQGTINTFTTPSQGNGKLIHLNFTTPTNHNINTTIIINGVNNPKFTKHTIEDHLLTIAEHTRQHTITDNTDPKTEWNKLDKDKQYKVYKTILTNKKLAEEVFKQHIQGLKQLIK